MTEKISRSQFEVDFEEVEVTTFGEIPHNGLFAMNGDIYVKVNTYHALNINKYEREHMNRKDAVLPVDYDPRIDSIHKNLVGFGEIEVGGVFIYDDVLWYKDKFRSAYRLTDNHVTKFHKRVPVYNPIKLITYPVEYAPCRFISVAKYGMCKVGDKVYVKYDNTRAFDIATGKDIRFDLNTPVVRQSKVYGIFNSENVTQFDKLENTEVFVHVIKGVPRLSAKLNKNTCILLNEKIKHPIVFDEVTFRVQKLVDYPEVN